VGRCGPARVRTGAAARARRQAPIARGEAARLMPLLVDTGILYALADRSDAWHARAVKYLRQYRPTLLAPVTVIPEAAYLVRARLGEPQERKLIEALANRSVALEPLLDADVARTAELMAKYRDLGFVDCSVVAVAERLKLDTIATTDRPHFALVAPRHARRFTLVP
jgi:predicted nucleic acid-binding protein